MTYRLGVDVGGTFTDLVLVDATGAARTRKLLSTTLMVLPGCASVSAMPTLALAMHCVIVDMRTHVLEANRVDRPTIAHVPTGIVHRLTRSGSGFEIIPRP